MSALAVIRRPSARRATRLPLLALTDEGGLSISAQCAE